MFTDLMSSAFRSAGGNNMAAPVRAQRGVFYREGEYWTIGISGKTVRLKDSKGLTYIAHLLRHPGVDFHALELARGIAERPTDLSQGSAGGLLRGNDELANAGIHIGGLGDAGEVLDKQAKRAYRQRIAELQEDLGEAKARGKAERAEQLEEEMDTLAAEVSRAVGLGGRSRRAACAAERARQSVTKSIKAVMQRIAQSDGALGETFWSCIKTGTFCSYQPDRNSPITWEVGAPNVRQPEQPSSGAQAAVERLAHIPAPLALLRILSFLTYERTQLVCREKESAAIRAVPDRTQQGHGAIVILAGGPAMGKTRLAFEMEEYAGEAFTCLSGRCLEDEPFPYLPFVQIIEVMLAEAPSLENFPQPIGRKCLGNCAARAQPAATFSGPCATD